MVQRWREVLFLHWPVDAAALRALIPEPLAIDTFRGQAWLGIVPFRMEGVRIRLLPPFPGTHAFPELNVRTYVTHQGKSGVWFFSLDAQSSLAVAAARAWFGLPYYYARMRCNRVGDEVTYKSERRPAGARFEGRYRPVGEAAPAEPGTLEHWLVERYCLFATKRGRIFIGEIEHPPWPLQRATAEFTHEGLAPVALPEAEPRCHYASGVDVDVWSPRPVA
ncbi:MAG: YqjF family protein [Planctomycetota bacterium]|jgi:uncharacterized protein YqjF (DUF2071 family)